MFPVTVWRYSTYRETTSAVSIVMLCALQLNLQWTPADLFIDSYVRAPGALSRTIGDKHNRVALPGLPDWVQIFPPNLAQSGRENLAPIWQPRRAEGFLGLNPHACE